MARIQNNSTKKIFTTQKNYDGVITHLEPDILECEVKWALESITTNKARRAGRPGLKMGKELEWLHCCRAGKV